MITTVNEAFNEFMKSSVNLDPKIVSIARSSRDNLLENIREFDNDDGFFCLMESFNVQFGSFARKTKCRNLNDIDLMIGISANGATYMHEDPWYNIRIIANSRDFAQKVCTRYDGTLNSTSVMNCFKKKLENVREYSKSELNKKGEAIVLNLKSREWSFDIIPCFRTVTEKNGRFYYIIPNGTGNWKKTDPIRDREYVTNVNKKQDGKVLELIRLCKKWNKDKSVITIPSYILETLIINYCEKANELSNWIDVRFKDSLLYISTNILNDIYDMKDIQGNINTLNYEQRFHLSQRALIDYKKACDAISYEVDSKDHRKSINKWKEVFGDDFPRYNE